MPPNDADQVRTNSNDQLDLYGANDLAGSINTVKCVQVQARCNKEGTPTPQNIKLACRTHASDYVSADKAVPSTSKSLFNIWENNPNTSAPWTLNEVNDVEIGLKSTA